MSLKLREMNIKEIGKEIGSWLFIVGCIIAVIYLISLIPIHPSGQIAHDTCDLSIIKDGRGYYHPDFLSMEDEAYEFYSGLGNPVHSSCNPEGEPTLWYRGIEDNEITDVICKYSCHVQFEPTNFSTAITLPLSLTKMNNKKEIEDWRGKSIEEIRDMMNMMRHSR